MTYLRLLPYAAIAVLAALWLWSRNEATEATARAEALELHVASLEGTIADLKGTIEQQNRNTERLMLFMEEDRASQAALARAQQRIAGDVEASRLSIQQLEADNEEVRSYLQAPIPDALLPAVNRGR